SGHDVDVDPFPVIVPVLVAEGRLGPLMLGDLVLVGCQALLQLLVGRLGVLRHRISLVAAGPGGGPGGGLVTRRAGGAGQEDGGQKGRGLCPFRTGVWHADLLCWVLLPCDGPRGGADSGQERIDIVREFSGWRPSAYRSASGQWRRGRSGTTRGPRRSARSSTAGRTSTGARSR